MLKKVHVPVNVIFQASQRTCQVGVLFTFVDAALYKPAAATFFTYAAMRYEGILRDILRYNHAGSRRPAPYAF